MALNYTQLKNLKPRDKLYKLSDGGGLSLWIYPTGKMRWALAYREAGKQKNIYLGEYPIYSLADAREWRNSIKNRQERNLPVIDRSLSSSAYLFENVYQEWFKRWAPQKQSEKYTKQVKAAIEKNISLYLYGRDVRDIKSVDIVQSLRGMEERGALEYLRRVKSSLNMIFDYAVSTGLLEFNPVASVGSQAFVKPTKKHFDALSPKELPLLIRSLENGRIKGVSRLAIYWQMATMTRPIEAVSAKWADIDLDNKSWEIPPEVMKKKRIHVIPLSDFAISLLAEIRSLNIHREYLFEGADYMGHLNSETPRVVLRRAGLNTTAHGLRALTATILEEEGYPEAIIKAALSHSKGNGDKNTPAYLRSTFYPERAKLMTHLGNIISKEISLIKGKRI